jgi:Tfp pilus assembly protein PilO
MTARLRKGSWVITLPLAGLAVGYLFLFYLPGRRAISKATDQVEKQTQVIQQGSSLLDVLQSTEKEAQRAGGFVSTWEAQSPAADKLSKLYGEIYALAEQAGTATTSFDPQAVIRGERIIQIPLNVGYRGKFSEVFAFLKSLESLPYDVWTTNLHMERLEEDGQSVSCKISLIVFASNLENSGYAEQSD